MSEKENTYLTPREMDNLLAVVKLNKGVYTIDFDDLATEVGLKNAATARNMWNRLKLKLGIGNDGDKSAPSSTTKNSSPNKKRKAEDEGDAEESSPAPIRRKSTKKTSPDQPVASAMSVKSDDEEKDLDKVMFG